MDVSSWIEKIRNQVEEQVEQEYRSKSTSLDYFSSFPGLDVGSVYNISTTPSNTIGENSFTSFNAGNTSSFTNLYSTYSTPSSNFSTSKLLESESLIPTSSLEERENALRSKLDLYLQPPSNGKVSTSSNGYVSSINYILIYPKESYRSTICKIYTSTYSRPRTRSSDRDSSVIIQAYRSSIIQETIHPFFFFLLYH